MIDPSDALRRRILDLVTEYVSQAFASKPFIPGQTPIPVAGRVFDANEVCRLVDSSLDFWLTTGRFADAFELALARAAGARYAILVNSGSSANLLALACLTSPALGERRLQPGDEVITCAAGFPTTVNPVLQNGLIPVFIDAVLPSYNADLTQLDAALSDRTRAVILAHTLGNPFDAEAVRDFCRRHRLWMIEDCCDALGSTLRGKPLGSFGDLATLSFYPAHHITTGEGGAVLTHDDALRRLVVSFRDWGRDCWCDPGRDNTCGGRFGQKFGGLPFGYDHKYVYSHVGYNLKMTDMQAAVGLAQLEKLPRFIEARLNNFTFLREALGSLGDLFVLPGAAPESRPSWFGFPLTVREQAPFDRRALILHLESRRIGTRLLFGGNLTRQPAYDKCHIRSVGPLQTADLIMNRTFWIGVYPGLTREMIEYVVATIRRFCRP